MPGVRVGHPTLIREADGAPDAVRTGVTAIFPHEGEPWQEWVYAGTHILNGYGELIGINQVTEWGLLMCPIVLTSSLQIGKAYDATVRWIAGRDRRAPRRSCRSSASATTRGCQRRAVLPACPTTMSRRRSTPHPGRWPRGASAPAPACVLRLQRWDRHRVARLPPTPAGYTVGVLVLTNYGDREYLRIDGVQSARRSRT